MDAIVLAGGFGTRLRPLTYTRPKPLLPVAGRPMLDWVLDRLPPEVDHVILAVNWLAEELEAYAHEAGLGVKVTVIRETEPLGTAGAVANCAHAITSDKVFVLNGDIVSDMDLQAQLHAHNVNDAVATISLREVEPEEVVHFGVAEVAHDASHGAVKLAGFVEKPSRPQDAPSRLINAGAYLLERSVIDAIPKGRMVSMEKEIFPILLGQGMYGHAFQGSWIDVGDPARLLQAAHHVDPEYSVGRDTNVADDVVIENAVTGDRCDLASGVVLRDTILGDDVRIAAGVILEGCVVGDGEVVAASATDARIWTRPKPAGYPDKQVGNALNAPPN